MQRLGNFHGVLTLPLFTITSILLISCGGSGSDSNSGSISFELKRPNPYVPRDPDYENAGGVAEGAAAIDANADGLVDLFRAPSHFNRQPERTIEIYLNQGNGRFVESASSIINPVPLTGYINHPTIVADFNGDGNDDLFLVDHGLEIGNPSTFPFAQPKLLLSNGSGQLTNVTLTNLPTVVEFNHNASVGDVDNDGDLDILVVALSDIRIYLLINDGVGNFTLETDVFPENVRSYDFGPGSVQLADVNNDGRLDAIIGSYGNAIGNAISICLQTQTGQFVENQRVPISAGLGSGGFSQIVSDDFDNDNDIDLIAFNDVGNAGLMALRNDGGNFIDVSVEWLGQFRLFSSYPNTLITGLEVHDFNGDNIPDLSFAHYGMQTNEIGQFILINDGTGRLSPISNAGIGASLNLTSPIFLDHDDDGDTDIVGFSRSISVPAPNVFVETGYEIVVLENKN